jgi:hypothetical protein
VTPNKLRQCPTPLFRKCFDITCEHEGHSGHIPTSLFDCFDLWIQNLAPATLEHQKHQKYIVNLMVLVEQQRRGLVLETRTRFRCTSNILCE